MSFTHTWSGLRTFQTGRTVPIIFMRNARRHRTIQVQLTADVPGLGAFGSVQIVNPGRMRNQLYPAGQATYIPRGAAPKLLERPQSYGGPVVAEVDFAELELSLRELPELVFRRRLQRTGARSTDRNRASQLQPIFGSVTAQEVQQRLSDSHHITLLPPDAILEFSGGENRLRSAGKHRATVTLRNGIEVPLVVSVEGDE